MMECVDPLIPTSNLFKRLSNNRKSVYEEWKSTSWWNFKKRFILLGSLSVYDLEINDLLELSAKTQPIIRDSFKEKN